MICRVVVTPTASRHIDEAFAYIYERSPQNAERWLAGVQDAIGSLRRFPRRCGIAPETRFLGEELRHFIYKSHRIIYRIESRVVRILYVRHGARRPVGDPASEEDA